MVDPQRPDDTSGLGHLCGTGIAFKLVQALVPALGLPANLPYYLLDLVALATVADVVPLHGENRILVKHGLRLLAESNWHGVRALVEASGLAARRSAPAHLGFILGPRLNAAGRIGDAADGLRLLLSDDMDEAAGMARRLEGLNVERQAIDQRILDEALGQVELARSRARLGLRARRRRLASRCRRDRGVARGRALRPAGVPHRVRGRHRQGHRAAASPASISTRRSSPAATCWSATAATRWRPG